MRFTTILNTVIVTLVVTGFAAAGFTGAQSPPAPQALLDLPAAVLTPADAENMGITGLGRFENGYFRTMEDYSRIRADFLQIPLADVESALAAAGYVQGYTSNLGTPERPGDPESPPVRVVFSSIYQYETAEGAAAAFAFNTRYDGVTIATVDDSLQPSAPFGDELIMTRTTSATMEEEGPSDQIDTVFRIGNIVAAAGIIDFGMSAEEVATPGPTDPEIQAQVEQLAARLIERIEATLSGSAPSLSGRSLHLIAKDADPGWTSEGYRRIWDEDIPYYNGFEDDFGSVVTPEMVAVYEVVQPLGNPQLDPFDPFFAERVFLFSSEDAAARFLDGIERVPGAISEMMPAEAESIGPGAKLIQYDLEIAPDLTALGYQVWQQSGTLVSLVFLESADHRPSMQVIMELAAVQATCLSQGCEPVPLPESW